MIEVNIFRDKEHNIVKYTVAGHARRNGMPRIIEYILRRSMIKSHTGYPAMGRDVICAAVSSVAQSPIIGLTRVLGIVIGVETDDGFLECIMPDTIDKGVREKANTILETMVQSLQDMEKQYTSFIRISETEV